MRSLLILLSLALLATSCNVDIRSSDAPFTLDSLMAYDYKGVEKLFGADKLRDSLVQDANGAELRYTLVMPGTPAAVRLQWTDTSRSMIEYATISGNTPRASAWKTRDSVTVGITLTELEKINGTSFIFYNDGPGTKYDPPGTPSDEMGANTGEPGYVMMWGDGTSTSKLQGRVHKVRLNASIQLPAGGYQTNVFSSNSPEAIANNPIVTEVTVSMYSLKPQLVVETIVFTTPTGSKSNIPHVMVAGGKKDPRVDSINAVLLNYFDLESFDPKKAKHFPWSSMTFEAEMDGDLIALHLKGTYVSSYPTEIDEMLFINTAGYRETEKKIRFHTLFAYDGYFTFLDKYWSANCEIKMTEAEDCAGVAPSCNCFEVEATIVNNKVRLSVKSDCYPHAVESCSPKLEVMVPLEELKPYLNDFGMNLVFDRDYYRQTALKRHRIENEVQYNWPEVFFLRFDITYNDGVSPPDEAKMGFQLVPDENDPFNGKIIGWLSFDNTVSFDNTEQKPIKLEGKYVEGAGIELWDPSEGITLRFPLHWVMADESYDKGYFDGGTGREKYSFIAVLYSNVDAFGPRGD